MKYSLVMFSGGIDSTYCIYKLLKEDYIVHTHFINFHHKDIRYKAEYKAVRNILKWFKEDIPYTESVMKFNHRIPNICTIGYGAIHAYLDHKRILERKGVKDFKLDVIYGSERDRYEWSREDKKVMQTIFNSYFDYRHEDEYKPKLYSPILDIWKADMFKELPKDLLDLTWTCRRPTDEFKECGKCAPCLRNERQKKGERIDVDQINRKF